MSLSFNINTAHPTPLYHQLERAIRFAIATGKLAIGDQLPTVRQLAVDLRINANTVAKVYAELEREGVDRVQRRAHADRCQSQPERGFWHADHQPAGGPHRA